MNQNLVKVNKKKLEVLIDLRYSTSQNFTKEKVFLSNECYIHKVAYEHLDLAVQIAKKQNPFIFLFEEYIYPSKTLFFIEFSNSSVLQILVPKSLKFFSCKVKISFE